MTIDGVRVLFLFLLSFILLYSVLQKYNLKKVIIALKEIWPIFPFVLYSSFSLLWSITKSYSIRAIIPMFYLLILYVSIRNLLEQNTKKKIVYIERLILKGFWIAVVLTSFSLIFLLHQGKLFKIEEVSNVARIGDYPNLYFLSPWLFYLFGIYYLTKWISRKEQKKYLLYYIFLSLYIVFTVTRTYIFMLISGTLFVLFILNKSPIKKILALPVGFLTFLMFFFIEPLKRRMFFYKDITLLDFITSPSSFLDLEFINFSGRINVWEYLIEKLHSSVNPILGGGIGTSRAVLKGGKVFGSTAYAHGDYIKFYAELGYIGIALYIFLLLYLFFLTIKKISESQNEKAKVNYAIFGAGIIGVIVMSIAYDGFLPIGYLEFVFYFLASANSLNNKNFKHHVWY